VLAVLGLAAPRYRSAERGLRFLPPRAALSVLTAARLYEAIGTRIRQAGSGAYWRGRAVVPGPVKAALTLRALAAAPRLRRAQWDGAGHEPVLHASLDGLPGANQGDAA
jgi:phytoene synthase